MRDFYCKLTVIIWALMFILNDTNVFADEIHFSNQEVNLVMKMGTTELYEITEEGEGNIATWDQDRDVYRMKTIEGNELVLVKLSNELFQVVNEFYVNHNNIEDIIAENNINKFVADDLRKVVQQGRCEEVRVYLSNELKNETPIYVIRIYAKSWSKPMFDSIAINNDAEKLYQKGESEVWVEKYNYKIVEKIGEIIWNEEK